MNRQTTRVGRFPGKSPRGAFVCLFFFLISILIFPAAVPSSAAPVSSNLPIATAWASSIEGAQYGPARAFDGNGTTRWASATYHDPEWIAADLGATCVVTSATIIWQNSFAKAYELQSGPGTNGPWLTVWSTNTNLGGTNVITSLNFTSRYVRLLGTVRGSTGQGVVGYSIWTANIYGYPATAGLPSTGGAGVGIVSSPLAPFQRYVNEAITNASGVILTITGIVNRAYLPLPTTNNFPPSLGLGEVALQYKLTVPTNQIARFTFEGTPLPRGVGGWVQAGPVNTCSNSCPSEYADRADRGFTQYRGKLLP